MFNPKLAETATALARHCNAGTEAEALDTLYHPDCESAEALDMGGEMPRVAKGLDAIRAKHDWWFANNEVHSTSAEGPFMHGDDTFHLVFEMDVTDKTSGQRMQMKEVGQYTIDSDGKIIREAFAYPPMEM